MAGRSVTALKFVGTISLGLLTGMSYTVSSTTMPNLLSTPTTASAQTTFTNLATQITTHESVITGASAIAFLLAFTFSPRGARHPYLVWASMLAGCSVLPDLVLRSAASTTVEGRATKKNKAEAERRAARNPMDASYEVLGDSHSEGGVSEVENEVNSEDVAAAMHGFLYTQAMRSSLAAVAFTLGLVGLWGDGA